MAGHKDIVGICVNIKTLRLIDRLLEENEAAAMKRRWRRREMKYDEAQTIIYGYTTALRMGHKLNKDQWIEYDEALRVVLQRAEQETI